MKRFTTFVRTNARGLKQLYANTIWLVTGYVVLDPFERLLGQALGPAHRFMADQLEDNAPGYMRRALNVVLVSLCCTLCTVVFFQVDKEYLGLTLPALGVTPPVASTVVETDDAPLESADAAESRSVESGPNAPASTDSDWITELSSYSFILVVVVWGFIWGEAWGLAHILPPSSRGVMWFWRVSSSVALVIVLGLMIAMGAWRVDQLIAPQATPANVTPGERDERAVVEPGVVANPVDGGRASREDRSHALARFVGSVLPLSVVITTAVTVTGVLYLARFVVLAALIAVLTLPAILYLFVIPALKNVSDYVVSIGHQIIDLVAGGGDSPPAEQGRARQTTADAGPDVSTEARSASQKQAEAAASGVAHDSDRNWGFGSEGVNTHE